MSFPHVGKDGRPHVIPMIGLVWRCPSGDEARTLLHADPDVVQDTVALAGRDERTEVSGRVGGVADPEALGHRGQ